MNIHFYYKGTINDATARFRGILMAKYIAGLGQDVFIHKPLQSRPSYEFSKERFKELIKNFKILFSLGKADVLYLVRTIYQIDFLLLVIFFKLVLRKKFVFDFDDPKYMEFPLKMKIMTKLANFVIVGSHSLKSWADKYNSHVYILPTSIPFDIYSKYTKVVSKNDNGLVIGWLGNAPNHINNLKIIIPVFEKLLKEGFKFNFTLIGSLTNIKVYKLFDDLKDKGLSIKFIDNLEWSDLEVVPKNIQNFDIGIMPLVGNEWNKGKCSFKAIEYMAGGIATVASDIGENKYLISPGQNGFLASTSEEWYNNLKDLLIDFELRKKIGLNAQETIKIKYSLEQNSKELLKIFKNYFSK